MKKHGGPQARDANSENFLFDCVNWKPVICAAHGYVLGLALGIALECDLIVAEEGTKFQVTEAPRGLSGAKYWALLNFRGGGSFAMQTSLTGRFFTAEEAFQPIGRLGRGLLRPARRRARLLWPRAARLRSSRLLSPI